MLKGAIIGTGKIAMTGHMPAYGCSEVNKHLSIAAAVDTVESSAENFRRHFNIPVYNSLPALLKEQDIDFIDICVPPNNHRQYIEESVNYSLPVICEKPFCLDEKNARYLAALLKKSGTVFIPCHQYKYSPVWSCFKELADTHPAKWLLQFNISRLQADTGFNKQNAAWRTDRKFSGGGILADTGVHYLYLVPWILGSPVCVTARTYSLKQNRYSVEDTALVIIECEKGTAQINLTWSADKRANSASLVSEAGSLYYNGETLTKHINGVSELIPVPDVSDKTTYIQQYVCLFNEFTNLTGSGTGRHISEAYDSVRLLNAAYSSAEKNITITLD